MLFGLTGLSQAHATGSVPDAGQLLRELPERAITVPESIPDIPLNEIEQGVLPDNDGPKFMLYKINLLGNVSIPTDELENVIKDTYGKEIGLGGIKVVAQRLSQYYRSKGYLLARAYIPPQTLKNGAVEIRILEGVVEDKRLLTNVSHVKDNVIEGLVERIPEGKAARQYELNRALMILSEQPGLENILAVLRPGQQTGGTIIEVEAAEAPRNIGRVFFDNQGNRYTGQNRLGAQASVNNLFGYTDQLNLSLLGTEENTWSGHLGWDTLLANNGVRGGISASSSHYELGRDYRDLDANGTVNAVSLYGSYPLLRRLNHLINLNAEFEQRWLKDRFDAVDSETDKKIRVISVGASGRHVDVWGGSAWNVKLTVGDLDISTLVAREIDRAGAKSEGRYTKLTLLGRRDQQLFVDTFLRGQFQGQLADKNLDSSEKFFLGGSSGVRAYPQGEAFGDQGWLAKLELRHALSEDWQVGAGYDAGGVQVNKNRYQQGDNFLTRSGAALFAEGIFGRFDLSASIAWRTDSKAVSSPDKKPRIWLQAGMRF